MPASNLSRVLGALWLPLLLAGCLNMGDRRAPIPFERISGSGTADRKTLVIVLPGRADNVEVMREFGVAEAIQAGWPEVDVQLTSATLAYYTDGGLPERVRAQFIEPARAQGYERLILMGASMGGMGSLVLDEAHPGVFEHVVLMAPYLGRKRVMREVEAAGGIAEWQPGPKPEVVDRRNFDRELLWRQIASYARTPALRERVWLAYGEEDRLAATVPVIAPALDSTQILPRPGGHKWVVWNAAATEIFARLRREAAPSAP
ncbi:MAG: alpha/beta hydrolase [Xanthomonadales bacterium]|nr:alpha/beta hydrolase [Xanthomonadales bacterium]